MGNEIDNSTKAEAPAKDGRLKISDGKDVDLFGTEAAKRQEALAQERLVQEILTRPDFSLKSPTDYSLKPPVDLSFKPTTDFTLNTQFDLTPKPQYDFTLKPWMVQAAAEPSPLSTTRGPNLRVEDFQMAPKLKFNSPNDAADLDFRGPGLMDDERQRRIDTEWRTRRERTQDRIADQIAPGLGRFEWTSGEQKWRLDYLNVRNCKVRGVGVCLTVRGF